MKRERLHDWLMSNCPAYRNLDSAGRAEVLGDGIRAYETEFAGRRRRLTLVLAVFAVGVAVLLWGFNESAASMVGPLAAALIGVGSSARYFLAEYVERRVRERAVARARGATAHAGA